MTFLTSYFDDSGTDHESEITALGGPIMTQDAAQAFNLEWSKLLRSYEIFGPLHMTDFVRPAGRYVGMHKEMKLALFRTVTKVIRRHQLYSLAVLIPQLEFRSLMPEEACKELIGPYALAFFSAVMFNQTVADMRSRRLKKHTTMAYLIDDGCSHADQLRAAHSLLLRRESTMDRRYTGAMGFDTDDRVAALQAADVIAWTARRRQLRQLEQEFDPLKDLLAYDPAKPKESHATIKIPPSGIEMWAKPIRNWLLGTGRLPKLDQFVL